MYVIVRIVRVRVKVSLSVNRVRVRLRVGVSVSVNRVTVMMRTENSARHVYLSVLHPGRKITPSISHCHNRNGHNSLILNTSICSCALLWEPLEWNGRQVSIILD